MRFPQVLGASIALRKRLVGACSSRGASFGNEAPQCHYPPSVAGGRKPGAVAKHADAVRARALVIVGDRDLEAGTAQVKELATGATRTVPLAQLAQAFRPGA